MSVTYLTTPIVEVRNDPPPRGSGLTRDGYTKRSGAPTARMIRLQGEKRWRRLMVWQFSNLGTLFVRIDGEPHVVREEMIPQEGTASARVHHATKKSPAQLEREIAEALAPHQGRWDDSPGAWQRGYEFAQESTLHETRTEQREILQRVAAGARSAYDHGFVAGYQDALGVPRSSSTGRRAHSTKKGSAQEPITEVAFRVFPEGDVIALFPQDKQGAGMINSYQRLGQHGEASQQLVKELRRASPAEYAPLLAELKSIGYRLRVGKR